MILLLLGFFLFNTVYNNDFINYIEFFLLLDIANLILHQIIIIRYRIILIINNYILTYILIQNSCILTYF